MVKISKKKTTSLTILLQKKKNGGRVKNEGLVLRFGQLIRKRKLIAWAGKLV